jgi:hypothetical protein
VVLGRAGVNVITSRRFTVGHCNHLRHRLSHLGRILWFPMTDRRRLRLSFPEKGGHRLDRG